jgi:phosphoribosylaminoimidazole (AIR) synthetase
VGYYLFVPKEEVAKILKIGKDIGYELADIGIVEKGKKGKRQVIFEPEQIILTPPGK